VVTNSLRRENEDRVAANVLAQHATEGTDDPQEDWSEWNLDNIDLPHDTQVRLEKEVPEHVAHVRDNFLKVTCWSKRGKEAEKVELARPGGITDVNPATKQQVLLQRLFAVHIGLTYELALIVLPFLTDMSYYTHSYCAAISYRTHSSCTAVSYC
jgi:hypothetical protein